MSNNQNNAFWRASAGTPTGAHSVDSSRYVTATSTHDFSITNKHGTTDDEANFSIGYNIKAEVALDVDDNGNPTDWVPQITDPPPGGIVDSFAIPGGGTTKTHLDAAVEPDPDIDYLRSVGWSAQGNTWYRIKAYTVLNPPDNPDYGDNVRSITGVYTFFVN